MPEKRKLCPGYEVCGLNPIVPDLFPAERMGCGQAILYCRDVYRCTDCRTPFHLHCAQGHFARHAAAVGSSGATPAVPPTPWPGANPNKANPPAESRPRPGGAPPADERADLWAEIQAERVRQNKKWGGQGHDDEHTSDEWVGYIVEHAKKSLHFSPAQTGKASHDFTVFRRRMIEVAALAVAALESEDRKFPSARVAAGAPRPEEMNNA